ncbi:MAG: septum formation initiator family protein [Candidatus Paceibacteria bacterium]
MKEKDKNKTIKKIFQSKLFLVVLIVLVFLVGSAAFRSLYRNYKVNREITRLEKKVDNLKKEKIESMKILEYVSSKKFAEKKARTELNLKKNGEKVMVIKDEDSQKKNGSEKKEQQVSNPVKWWYYFTNKKFN